jgi:hypothetical protein
MALTEPKRFAKRVLPVGFGLQTGWLIAALCQDLGGHNDVESSRAQTDKSG